MAKTKINYPIFKKVLWRFVRVFVATFLAIIATNITNLTSVDQVVPLLLVPALTGGLSALSKALREYVASGDYENHLHKIII